MKTPYIRQRLYKLTDKNLQTYRRTQWFLGKWKSRSGEGALCGPGWLHAYEHPLIATLMHPIHVDFYSPRLFECEWDGERRDDSGLKCGVTRLRLIREIPFPRITGEQRVRFAIRCAIEAGANDADWIAWALHWLDGDDRAADRATYTASVAEMAASAANAGRIDLVACAEWAVSE